MLALTKIGALLVMMLLCSKAHAKWPADVKPLARAMLAPENGSSMEGTVDFASRGKTLLVRAYLADAPRHGVTLRIQDGTCNAGGAAQSVLGQVSRVPSGPIEMTVAFTENVIGKSVVVTERGADKRVACGDIVELDSAR